MLAINMEIPKSCSKCPFKAILPNAGLKNGVCNDLHLPFKRHPYCPLIEIITCKDCKHNVKNGKDKTVCIIGHRFKMREPSTFYCPDAKRRL